MKKKLEEIYRVAAASGGAILFIIAVLVTVDVIIRKVISRPILGVFEVTEVSFLIIFFLAIAHTQNMGRQIRIDILYTTLKEKTQCFLDIVNYFACLIFFGILLWSGFRETVLSITQHYVRRGIVEIPSAIPLSFLVLGCIMMCVHLLTVLPERISYIVTPSPVKTEIQK